MLRQWENAIHKNQNYTNKAIKMFCYKHLVKFSSPTYYTCAEYVLLRLVSVNMVTMLADAIAPWDTRSSTDIT